MPAPLSPILTFPAPCHFFLELEKAQEENGQHQLLTLSFPWLCRFLLVHPAGTGGVGTGPQPWHLQLLLLFRLAEKCFN